MRRTIERLRAEFLEMPGLRLTVAQTQRLCGVDQTLCQDVLDALVDVKFLRVNPDGTYARLSEGEIASACDVTDGAVSRLAARTRHHIRTRPVSTWTKSDAG
jgi:hypothetical protein